MTREYPRIQITGEMISTARHLIEKVRVNRTVASKIDTLTGILGEFAFAQFFWGDWKKHRVGSNKGEVDFDGIEIKTSAFPFRDSLNLLVREDYAKKRKPQYYVQVIIDVSSEKADDIKLGSDAYICGFATSEEVDKAPKKDFGSKIGPRGGYRCHFIQISGLHPIEEFRSVFEQRQINGVDA